ncbi:MAG: hypothetical protein WD768_02580 [Phycisphaeraceae bacterium]
MKSSRAFTLTELVASFVLVLLVFGFTQAIIGCDGGKAGAPTPPPTPGPAQLSPEAVEHLRKATDDLRAVAADLKDTAESLRKTAETQAQRTPDVDSSDLLAALGTARRNARQMQSSAQVRGIIQGMNNYAPGNNEFYPGFTSKGKEDQTPIAPGEDNYGVKGKTGHDPAYRYALMLRNSYFSPEYTVSPSETNKSITPVSLGGAAPGEVTANNFSFAMLELATGKARNQEWMATTNHKAAVVTDRNLGSDAGRSSGSVHTDGKAAWRGTVGFNDNHVNFETSNVLDLRYGENNPRVPFDNLFKTGDAPERATDAADPDAMMTYKGPSDGGVNQQP